MGAGRWVDWVWRGEDGWRRTGDVSFYHLILPVDGTGTDFPVQYVRLVLHKI
jgi:hypothetical protein